MVRPDRRTLRPAARRRRCLDGRSSKIAAASATAATATAASTRRAWWSKLATRNDAQLATLIHDGLPGRGMPGTPQHHRRRPHAVDAVSPHAAAARRAPRRRRLRAGGRSDRCKFELDRRPRARRHSADARRGGRCAAADRRRADSAAPQDGREVPAASRPRWIGPRYDGSLTGNRYTALTQINKSTVARLAPKWIYTIQNTTRLEGTPIVVDGIMYVTDDRTSATRWTPATAARSGASSVRERGAGRQRGRRHQPRRRGGERSRVHGDRSCAPARAQPVHGRAALGHRDGGLAPELQRHVGSADRRRSRAVRHRRR